MRCEGKVEPEGIFNHLEITKKSLETYEIPRLEELTPQNRFEWRLAK